MRPEPIEEARLRAESASPGQRTQRVIDLGQVVSPSVFVEARHWLAQRFGESTAQATYADFLATHTFDVMDRLEEIGVPTLVVGGEDDLWTPPKFHHYLAEHLPDARLVLLAHVGHYPFVEAADVFNHALEDFLAALGVV
jgi:pimeloyl-ACP methyl ester carboxylesterase